MKRLQLLAALLLCSLLSFAQFSGSGSGTENDPYLILNPIQLNQLRNYLNTTGVYFKLMADIDLTDYLEDENPDQGWQPVGSSSSAAFKGILDGNGKTISGLWINRGSIEHVGFFGYTTGATIKDFAVIANTIVGKNSVGGISGHSDNSTISGVSFEGTIKGGSMIGGIVGGAGDKLALSNCVAKVTINASENSIGGLVGKNDATYDFSISNCQVNDSKIIGCENVGGACGGNYGNHRNSNIVTSCYIHADVSGTNNVGGICGYSENLNLNNCGFIGNVNGTMYVGGLVGYVKKTYYRYDSHINCFAIGSVLATNDYAGGLIGMDVGLSSTYYNDISDCYFSGSVTGKNYIAGLVGYKKYGTISNSYSMASIVGAKYVGGLVGFNSALTTIKKSVAINTRVTATEGEVARIVGHNEGTIATNGSTEENKSYNRTIVISQGVASDITDDLLNGTGVSKTTLKLKATYVAMGWDFTNTWDIQETECYPYFKIQTAPPVITSQLVSRETSISGKCVDGGTVTLEVDGTKQQMVSTGNQFFFDVTPLQAGHDVRLCAKAANKEQSYYATETVSYLGKGTAADPYQVYTASDLTGVYRRGYFKLMNDIDLTDYINQFSPTQGWESIGRDGSETIHFDGDGYKITGLWCNSTRDNTGLFSCFANGEIKNLIVETANGKQVKGGANTGILIGKIINGTIENCRVSGNVADGTPVGGMVGLFDGGTITRCQANVTINTTMATSYVGGLVGEITGGTIDQCVTNGTLTGTGSESYVGGLLGKNSGTVTSCHSDAIVSSSYNAAGMVAYNYGVVNKCYAMGNLYSNNYAAGVIGYNDGANAIVQNCAAMNNKIEVVYESQQVQQGGGYGQRIIGGIKNSAPAPEMNNYALNTMQVSVNNVPQTVYDDIMNGAAKTEVELMSANTYQGLGWDFTNIWAIEEGVNYPKLSWESTTPIPSDVVIGDANGDGDVNVTDYLTVANYILGYNVEDFNVTAADVNEDNDVNVSDYVGIANIILYGNYTGSSANSIKVRNAESSSAWMELCETEDGNLNLLLHNAKAFSAFQMDINLPNGVKIAEATMTKSNQIRNLGMARLNDGTYRLLYGTLENKTVSLIDDGLLTLMLKRDINNIRGFVNVDNIILSHKDASSVRLSGVQTPMVTGIDMVDSETKGGIYYDLSGRRVADRPLKKGVYIVNGVKKFVK